MADWRAQPGPATLLDEIRGIARKLVGQSVTDYQITKVASTAGCHVRVAMSLDSLTMLERVALAKYILAEGRRVNG